MIGVGDEVKQRWSSARSVEGGGVRAGEVGFLLRGLGGRVDRGGDGFGWLVCEIEEGMDPERDLVEWRRRLAGRMGHLPKF